MADREKVFDAIRNCITEPKCKDCPWEDCERVGHKKTEVPVTLLLDVLELLREQKQQATSETERICYNCCTPLRDGDVYCWQCGRKVKQDG